jgi:hypothetical protein
MNYNENNSFFKRAMVEFRSSLKILIEFETKSR